MYINPKETTNCINIYNNATFTCPTFNSFAIVHPLNLRAVPTLTSGSRLPCRSRGACRATPCSCCRAECPRCGCTSDPRRQKQLHASRSTSGKSRISSARSVYPQDLLKQKRRSPLRFFRGDWYARMEYANGERHRGLQCSRFSAPSE